MNAVRGSVRGAVAVALTVALAAGVLLARAQEAPAAASRLIARPVSVSAQRRLSMDQAVRLAQRRYRARVVRAETQTRGGRTIYVLRMLDNAGRVFAVRVDAASGAIL